MKTLKPLINSLIKLIQNGVNFVKGQLPDVAVQILEFKKMEAIFELVFMTLLSTMLSVGLLVSVNNSYEVAIWVFGIGLAISSLCLVVCLYSCTLTLIQIKYAPKIFLLEYLKNFLSTSEE
jgi:hypothetical protein